MIKTIKGEYVNVKTNDKIINPIIKVKTIERPFFKITRSTLAKILWDLGNNKHRVLAVLIQNMNERTNHVYIGSERLIKYFENEGLKISKQGVIDTLKLLENCNFLKVVSENEIAINPMYLYCRNAENFQDDFYYYNINKIELFYTRNFKIKSVKEVKEIPYIPSEYGSNKSYSDMHFTKVKYEFLDILNKLGSKKIKTVTYLISNLKVNDVSIIIDRQQSGVNKETLNTVTKWLCQNKILYMKNAGAYLINPAYVTTKYSYLRSESFKYFFEQKNRDNELNSAVNQ